MFIVVRLKYGPVSATILGQLPRVKRLSPEQPTMHYSKRTTVPQPHHEKTLLAESNSRVYFVPNNIL